MVKRLPPILEVGGILLSSEILTERFCCDLAACKGACCIEGDAGAPVTMDEIGQIEELLDEAWPELSAQAQAVIDRQGVAYTDEEGDLVTSIVGGKDCVFTCYHDLEIDGTPIPSCCLCALERVARKKTPNTQHPTPITQHPTPNTHHPSPFIKPISCALYPIREKHFGDGTTALNLHHWKVCEAAFAKGREIDLPVYRFLKEPLTRRFGSEWYDELCEVAESLKAQGYL